MEVEGVETVSMDMDCGLHTVNNAVPMGTDVRTDAEILIADSDCDVVVGSVGDKGSEKDFHLGHGFGLSQDTKSDDGIRREDDLERRMGRDTGSSSSASNPHDSG